MAASACRNSERWRARPGCVISAVISRRSRRRLQRRGGLGGSVGSSTARRQRGRRRRGKGGCWRRRRERQVWLLLRAASVAGAVGTHPYWLKLPAACSACCKGGMRGAARHVGGSLRANSLAAGQSTQKRAQRLSLPPEQLLATQALWRTAPQAAAHQAASFRLRQKKAHRTGKELGRRPAQSTGLCRSQEVFASPRSAARQSGCLSTQNFHSRLHVKFWHGHPEPDITGRYVPQQSHRCCCQKTAAAAAGGSGL